MNIRVTENGGRLIGGETPHGSYRIEVHPAANGKDCRVVDENGADVGSVRVDFSEPAAPARSRLDPAIAQRAAAFGTICANCEHVAKNGDGKPDVVLKHNGLSIYSVKCTKEPCNTCGGKKGGPGTIKLTAGRCTLGKWDSQSTDAPVANVAPVVVTPGDRAPKFPRLSLYETKMLVMGSRDRGGVHTPKPKATVPPAPVNDGLDLAAFFDAVYCINLDRRPDRWSEFQLMVARSAWPFRPPERFAATDGRVEQAPDWFKAGPGAYGCWRSHVRAIEDAIAKDHDRILILEDDFEPLPRFRERVFAFLQALPDDWEQAYLGGQMLSGGKPKWVNSEVVKPWNVNRTHGYALSRKGMEKALAFLTDEAAYRADLDAGKHGHVDHRYGEMHMRGLINAYAPLTWLAAQAASKSDIRNREEPQRTWQWRGRPDPADVPSESPATSGVKAFKHSGNVGDILYALPTIAASGGGHLYLQLDVPAKYPADWTHPVGNFRLNAEYAKLITPLLLAQPYITGVSTWAGEAVDTDLDQFRQKPGRTLQQKHAIVIHPRKVDLDRPSLFVEADERYRDCIVVNRTSRYRNPNGFTQAWAALAESARRVVFLGTADEHAEFRSYVPNAEHIETTDFLESARIIAASRLFIGNQSSCFAIAETLKVNRLLEVSPQMPNCRPFGPNARAFMEADLFAGAIREAIASGEVAHAA